MSNGLKNDKAGHVGAAKKPHTIGKSMVAVCVFFPLAMVLISELMNRRDVMSLLSWIGHSPHLFLLNVCLISALCMLLTAITKRPVVAYLTIGFFCILCAVINMTLIATREHPFLPIMMYFYVPDLILMAKYSMFFRIGLPSIVVAIALVFFITLRVTNKRGPLMSGKSRVYILVMSLAILVGSVALTGMMSVNPNNFHQQIEKNGYWATFSQSALTPLIEDAPYAAPPRIEPPAPVPISISDSDINEADPGAENTAIDGQALADANENDVNKAPDIIIIKLESFTRGTDYLELTDGRDATSFFDALTDSCVRGDILVTPYGGNTTVTTTEVLSGYSPTFITPSTSFSGDVMHGKKEQKSIVGSIIAQGYQSAYFSCFAGEFVNEEGSVKAMGFGKFVGTNTVSSLPTKELYDLIVNEYESRDESKPILIAGMTMGNHFPFILGDDTEIAFGYSPSSKLSKLENAIAAGYLNGLALDDRFIRDLIDYFAQAENEVNIIFFADHRPFLGDTWSVYKKLGKISSDASPSNLTAEDVDFLYGVPYMIWNNKGQIPPENHIGETPIAAAYLLPILMEKRHIAGNDISDFLMESMKHVPNYGTASYKLGTYPKEYVDWYRHLCYRDLMN